MKRFLLVTALISLVFTSAAQAQNGATQLVNQSRISVLSKAGTPVPRPSVPVRYVPMPAGASRGTAYYYGWGGGGYGYGYGASYSSAPEDRTRRDSSIPGLITRPRSSYGKRR